MYLPLDAYQPAASVLGGAAGGGLGGALGHGLGLLSDTLSAPRRYLWRALGAPDSGAELLHQWAGMDPDSWLTKGLGMGVEMAGDPLTYLGAVPGLFKGAELGGMAGKALEGAALAKGPEYAGGLEKLLGSGLPTGMRSSEEAGAILDRLQASPGLAAALKEVPEGSTYLGHGTEAMTLRTPAGDVLRLQPPGEFETESWHGLARPDIPEVLQPTRAGLAGDIRVERTPFADVGAYKTPSPSRLDRYVNQAKDQGNFYDRVGSPMGEQALAQGYLPQDIGVGNVGRYEGRAVAVDPGAIVPTEGGPQPPALGQLGADPGGMQGWLLRALSSDQAVQSRLARQAGAVPTRSPLMARLLSLTR